MRIKLKGIRKIIKKVSLFERMNEMASEILARLGFLGRNRAIVVYHDAQYDGDNDIKVDWVSSNSMRVEIVATGKSIMFIEFGSGAYYNGYGSYNNPFPNPVDNLVPIGTYGNGSGSSGKYWFYYSDNEPRNPTDSYLGSGDGLAYIEKAHPEIDTRTWVRKKDGKTITRKYKRYRKDRLRTKKIRAGTNATKGNRPYRGMYEADLIIREQAIEVVKEVLEKYVGN